MPLRLAFPSLPKISSPQELGDVLQKGLGPLRVATPAPIAASAELLEEVAGSCQDSGLFAEAVAVEQLWWDVTSMPTDELGQVPAQRASGVHKRVSQLADEFDARGISYGSQLRAVVSELEELQGGAKASVRNAAGLSKLQRVMLEAVQGEQGLRICLWKERHTVTKDAELKAPEARREREQQQK